MPSGLRGRDRVLIILIAAMPFNVALAEAWQISARRPAFRLPRIALIMPT